MILLSVDPGREKCGLALLDGVEVKCLEIVETGNVRDKVSEIAKRFRIEEIIVGDGTAAKAVESEVREAANLAPVFVDETDSTLEARKLFFFLNPPTGWRRLLPIGLLSPPGPVDHYAALVLALARTGVRVEDIRISNL